MKAGTPADRLERRGNLIMLLLTVVVFAQAAGGYYLIGQVNDARYEASFSACVEQRSRNEESKRATRLLPDEGATRQVTKQIIDAISPGRSDAECQERAERVVEGTQQAPRTTTTPPPPEGTPDG